MFQKLICFRNSLRNALFKSNVVSFSLLTIYKRLYYGISVSDTSKDLTFSIYQKFLNEKKLNRNRKSLKDNALSTYCLLSINLPDNCYNNVTINFIDRYVSAYEHMLHSNSHLWKNFINFFKEPENFDAPVSVCFIHSYKDQMCEMAKEAWLKGNIVSSFDQFRNLYDKGDKVSQNKILKVLQQLVFHSIENNGIAVVTNVIQNVKAFSIEKNELSLLMTLWYALFISGLNEDNISSDNLLKESCLKKYLEPFIPYFGAKFLKNNEVGLYQRLIETTLCHNMDNAAGILLRLLFDYYYKTGYIPGCTAVYKCCIDLDIKLTKYQMHKYNVLKNTNKEMKNKTLNTTHPEDITYKF